MLRKIVLLFFMISLSVAVNAYDIVIDGIYYILDSDNQTASVTYKEHKNGAYKSDYEGDVSIPESVVHQGVNYRVTAIGSHAFQGCKGLTSISVPTSVRMIGHFAFIRCSNLKSVMLSEGLDTIRSGAFAQCEALESIVIPNTVTAVHEHAFAGCVNLVSATMGEGVTSIMNSVFTGCSSLTDIVLLGKITEIGGMAFYCCTSLNAFNIPESVEYVDYSAFEGCSGLLCIIKSREISGKSGIMHSVCVIISRTSIATHPPFLYRRLISSVPILTKHVLIVPRSMSHRMPYLNTLVIRHGRISSGSNPSKDKRLV